MRYITPAQFVKYRLSATIPQYIADLRAAKKKGLEIDMGVFVTTDGNGEPCAACLGGAAIIAFNSTLHLISIDYPGRKVGVPKAQWGKIAYTANYIRMAVYDRAYLMWYHTEAMTRSGGSVSVGLHNRIPTELERDLSKLSVRHYSIYGSPDANELNRLFRQMREFAAVLKKYGK